MKKHIANNPFRILGIYTNSAQKDIVRNLSRIKAFVNVGKEVTFPSDCPTLLEAPERDLELVSKAQSDINLPQDKIAHALFWFINFDSIDEIGINHLVSGDINKAISIFSKRKTFSSLINRAVASLIAYDIKDAAYAYETLLSNNDMVAEFVASVCGDTVEISKEDLSKILISTLCNNTSSKSDFQRWRLLHFARIYGKMKLAPFKNNTTGEEFKRCFFVHPQTEAITCVDFSSELGELTSTEIAERKESLWVKGRRNTSTGTITYSLHDVNEMPEEYGFKELINAFSNPDLQRQVKDIAIEGPIAKINSDIEDAKSVSRDDAHASHKAGAKLKTITTLHLNRIKDIVGIEDPRYTLAADNLAKHILQCGINYFNNTEDDDAIDKALELQEFALNLAVGKLVKDRCRQNVDILKKRKSEAAYAKDIDALVSKIKAFQNAYASVSTASQFIDNCMPHLETLKSAMGATNTTFIQISSAIANNALNMLIEALNKNSDSRTMAKSAQEVMYKLSAMTLDAKTRERVTSNSLILAGNIGRMPTGYEKADRATGGCLSQILGWVIFAGIIGLISLIAELFS